jgi:tetratricopeptide (TPR) repeat protein
MAGITEYQLQFHRPFQQIDIHDDSLLHHIQSSLPQIPTLHQLPPTLDAFVGRQAELNQVIELLKSRSAVSFSTVIVAIAGQAGVGKSALAVQIAHQIKQEFCDAQFYVNLRGIENQPLDPARVLASFLRAWGVDETLLPESLPQQSRLFQSLIAGKRIVIVLDNAGTAVQVRSLIPTGSDCVVLVTSRVHLSELEKAHHLDLRALSEPEALELLQCSSDVTQLEPTVAVQVINLCHCLPLGICLTANLLDQLLHNQPSDWIDWLTDKHKRMDQMHLSHPEVRASFALNYQRLAPMAAQLLRAIGLLVEANFSPAMAATLVAGPPESIAEGLNQLVTLKLIKLVDQNRYAIAHDLVRLCARAQLAIEDTTETRQTIRLRVSRWYLEICQLMNLGLDAETRLQLKLAARRQAKPSLATFEQSLFLGALNWFELERLNLIAAVGWAYQAEEWELTLGLAENLVYFFDIRTYWSDWEHTHLLALEAARNLGDRAIEAQIQTHLGNVYLRQSNWEKAQECYEQSFQICQELKHVEREARALVNLGIVSAFQNQREQAHWFWNTAVMKIPSDAPEVAQIRAWMQSAERLQLQRAADYFGDRPHQGSHNVFHTIGEKIKKFFL